MDLPAAIAALLRLPRAEQPGAVRRLVAELPPLSEPWNRSFDPDSLYDAFSQSSVATGVYRANREVLAPIVARPGFRVLEVGGGNGALWDGFLRDFHWGTIVVVDPHPDGAAGVRAKVPRFVEVEHVVAPVERASLPPADAAVCSLVLHHIAGLDAADRARVGLTGPGKREALTALAAAVSGPIVVNEADVYCDLALPPGDPLLGERLVDSYVRRFAVSLLSDLATHSDAGLKVRWERVVREWALGQVRAAELPWAERDVYELDVVSWLTLFERSGLRVVRRGFTDPWLLFHQYVLERAVDER